MSIISGMSDAQILQLAQSPGGSAALEKHIQATLFDNIHAAPVSAAPTAKRGRKPAAVKPAIEPPPTKRPLAKGQPTASTKPRKAKAEKASGGKGNKRDPEAIEALGKAFVDFVKAHPGGRMEEIGKALGETTKVLSLPVKKAIAAGLVRTTGNKRAMSYFPTSAAA